MYITKLQTTKNGEPHNSEVRNVYKKKQGDAAKKLIKSVCHRQWDFPRTKGYGNPLLKL